MIVLRKGRDSFDMYDFYMAEATKIKVAGCGRSKKSALFHLRENMRKVRKENKNA